ncbi:hypothetical protein M0R45_004833 [Rubus argutus]|uniref:Uncharacterized protein n=1 Tax=Rubus argutus TaxID=59490 RepID=A0AAW1YL22_RUBAR
MSHANTSSFPTAIPLSQAAPDSSGIVIETPAVADEKEFRMKTFTELFDKLPHFSRVVFFQELARKFFQSELVCWFRHLHSNDQQELIKNMLDDGKYSRGGDVGGCIPPLKYVGYNNIMLGMLLKFRKPLWKALKHSSAFRLRIFKELVPTFPWYWEGFSRLWELPAQGAHDQSELLFENSECDILQNLPDESEEDFRVRRFTEKFTKLNIPSQHYVLSQLFDSSSHTPPQVEEQDKRKAGKTFSFLR